ncbi:MAG: hypothetical protein ACLTX3_07065 [Lachnospiraceae bacterium]
MKAQVSGELPRFLDLLQAEMQIGMPIENAMLIICENSHPGFPVNFCVP